MVVKGQLRFAALMASLTIGLAACGGGGGASGSGAVLPPSGGSSKPFAQKLGVTLSGATGVAVKRAFASALPVSVTYNGAVVATGTLDSGNFAELTFTQDVPVGATVTVTIGSTNPVVATVTLASAISATSSDIVYNAGPPPTISVTSAADNNSDGKVDSSDSQQETATENPSDGQDQNVNSGSDTTLPSNLPITISVCDSTIIIAPAANAPSGLGLDFEEKVSDSDGSPQFEYKTATFTSPLYFPLLSTAARIDLSVTQNGSELVSIEAPIGSVTGSSGGASPSPSPSACPTVPPTGMPTPAPSTSPSAAPSASPSAAPSSSPTATATP